MENKRASRILFLIVLLGLFLRVYGIGDESFWGDESATVYTTKQNVSGIIRDIYTTTVHAPEYFESGGTPPLYLVLANYWTRLVGLSEAKLRMLSAIFGVMSIYVIFLIGKIIFDYRVGLISALILSLNYFHIYFSQEARTYSLSTLLALLTVFFMLSGLKQKNFVYWMAYVLSAALLVYSHYFGIFILLFEYLFLLILWKNYRESARSIIFSAAGIIVLYLPWIPALLREFSSSQGWLSAYLGKNVIYDIGRVFIQFNSWFTPDFQTRVALRSVYHSLSAYTSLNIFDVGFLAWLAIISILLLALLLGWFFASSVIIKNGKCSIDNLKDEKYLFVLMWFLVPVLMPLLITIIFPKSPIFGFIKYSIFASPAYYIIASKGIANSKKLGVIISLIILFSLLPLYSYYSNFDKQQWRETAEYLEANRDKDEAIFVNMRHSVASLGYYYKGMEKVTGIRNLDEMVNADKGNSFWLVYTAENYGDPQGAIKNYLDKNYKLSKKTEFAEVKIFNYVS